MSSSLAPSCIICRCKYDLAVWHIRSCIIVLNTGLLFAERIAWLKAISLRNRYRWQKRTPTYSLPLRYGARAWARNWASHCFHSCPGDWFLPSCVPELSLWAWQAKQRKYMSWTSKASMTKAQPMRRFLFSGKQGSTVQQGVPVPTG